MFGMHLRPELVLLQKTMVQAEGVSRGLDPQHDMWAAARPIVERWVRRELGAEAVAKRGLDELAHGLASLRRLPHTLMALEAAALKVGAEAPREERKWYQMPAFWLGALGGAVLAMLLISLGGDKPTNAEPDSQQTQMRSPISRQGLGPTVSAPIPGAGVEGEPTAETTAPSAEVSP
jgi:ubiquinone biosynthesis protein